MIDLAYIIESADYRMYRACPEIMTPDVKPYKPVLRIKYQKPRRIGRRGGHSSKTLPCERWNGRRAQRDISDIAKQARAAGMSYGEFMALKRSGKI